MLLLAIAVGDLRLVVVVVSRDPNTPRLRKGDEWGSWVGCP